MNDRFHIQNLHLIISITLLIVCILVITGLKFAPESRDIQSGITTPQRCYFSVLIDWDVNCSWAKSAPLFALLGLPIIILFLVIYWIGSQK